MSESDGRSGKQPATTVRTITVEHRDPLGYHESNVLDRFRHMAQDAVDGVNDAAAQAEVARVTARLHEWGVLPAKKQP